MATAPSSSPISARGRAWRRSPASSPKPGGWHDGAAYGYALLWVVVLASLIAMLSQALLAKLGIVNRHDDALNDAAPAFAD
ncbi:MAG: divalent metal cation transporter [Acidiphilium sp.]